MRRAAPLLAKTYVESGAALEREGRAADREAAVAADPALASTRENRDALFFPSR